MEGADIYQIAKNCRTSVEMIEKFYASHIKNRIDAAAVNVRRTSPAVAKAPAGAEESSNLHRRPTDAGSGKGPKGSHAQGRRRPFASQTATTD